MNVSNRSTGSEATIAVTSDERARAPRRSSRRGCGLNPSAEEATAQAVETAVPIQASTMRSAALLPGRDELGAEWPVDELVALEADAMAAAAPAGDSDRAGRTPAALGEPEEHDAPTSAVGTPPRDEAR